MKKKGKEEVGEDVNSAEGTFDCNGWANFGSMRDV